MSHQDISHIDSPISHSHGSTNTRVTLLYKLYWSLIHLLDLSL